MKRTVLITGVTGQLGSYLADLLLAEGCHVIGLRRRTSTNNVGRIKHNLANPDFTVVDGDITDISSIIRIFNTWPIVTVYNCAAQSFVATSFNEPIHTLEATGKGVVNLLEVCKDYPVRFIQLSSSEMYGSNVDSDGFQRETTPFSPNSPYAAAKLYAHNMVKLYRESYGMWTASVIAFNMESPRRGEEFVTKKITTYVQQLKRGEVKGKLKLGNLDAKRDWTYCLDTARGILKLSRTNIPDSIDSSFCFSSGECHSIREFLHLAFAEIGELWQAHVEVDERLFRPKEVPYLCGDSTWARLMLDWSPTTSFPELVKLMVNEEV